MVIIDSSLNSLLPFFPSNHKYNNYPPILKIQPTKIINTLARMAKSPHGSNRPDGLIPNYIASFPSNTRSGAAHRAAPPSSSAARRQASKSANQSSLTRALRSSLCLSQQPRPRNPRHAACPAGSLWSHQLFVAQSCLKKQICSLLCLV